MLRSSVHLAALLGIVLLASGSSATPFEPRSPAHFLASASRMPFRAPTAVPRGYFELCRSGNAVCQIRKGSLPVDRTGGVKLTPPLALQLIAVNQSVNKSVRPVADPIGGDRWSVGSREGDCEDYALTKKQALIRAGWPSSSLVIALAIANGQPHALLIVRTTAGDFALDNLRQGVVGWDQTGYRYLKVQSPNDVWTWHGL